MVDIPTVGIVSVPKRSALEASRRELSEDASFGIGTLLVVEQSSLEKTAPGGCDIHRRVRYSTVHQYSTVPISRGIAHALKADLLKAGLLDTGES